MKLRTFVLCVTLLFTATTFAATPAAISANHLAFTLLSFFGVGILLAFTPCVLPMVPILSAILIGEKQSGTARAFKLSLVFVISMALTYAAAGMLAGYLGTTLQTALQSPWIIISFSLVFVLMALSMFGLFNLGLPGFLQNRLHQLSSRQRQGSYAGVAIMGFLSTLIASPCVTAPLVSVLTYISQTGNAVRGGLILFFLALGMGLPLILFGIGQGALLPASGAWMNKIKSVFGIMMLGLAVWMLSRILPGSVTLFLWAALLIIGAVALGALDFHVEKRLPPFLHGLSILALLYGSILLMGAASGHDDVLNPLKPAAQINTTNAPAPVHSLFQTVANEEELREKLQTAKNLRKPVMIEFYASWCPACQALDKNVFADAAVQERMKAFEVLRVDITEKNDELMRLVDLYHVYGTPTVIFHDKDGREYKTNAMDEGITKAALMSLFDKLA
ncbi:Thiol:disulfide interchange protein DsbD [Aquicella siphonis]|uniref:Thiol:disulfide interchange protein DsbD n=1 Tax=Aquicella siphonis TaxID=254247 RepID=A0A5E4PJ41_9COXI|nr:protein-disulfide reductase DsbD [Aquicella siphonis]VVC76457.1 Thiol:disulfide interchange protein DsbD [Aquicella siphonis]